MNISLFIYTTRYRKGGKQFPAVARTLANERAASGNEQIVRAVESKRDVLRIFDEIKAAGKEVGEFHFVGHSGMYGPMFGTVEFPEQFSPFEWEQMEIPFAKGAAAYFHCCRSARWFAPFFARTFGVTAHGYFLYTTFSRSKERFKFAGSSDAEPLYTIGCKGRRSDGISASAMKFAGLARAEPIKAFEPAPPSGDPSYDRVAELYDAAFSDIRVRRDEWKWLCDHLPKGDIRMLDIGCGNGALLEALSGRIEFGEGVDESAAMIERAKVRNAGRANLDFRTISGPSLPFADSSFDVAVSLMSFRYLDWDPLLSEIKRVLRPEGIFLIVDMVTVPVKPGEYPRFLSDKLRALANRKQNAEFDRGLRRLVTDPAWKKMLEYNPIRSEHEMKWYLESRFPGCKMETLNIAWNSRIVAFDSGPVERAVEAKLSYP